MMIQPAPAVASSKDETLSRLVNLTNETNLCALDNTILSIKRSQTCFAAAAARTAEISKRTCNAASEVGMCLPPEMRARA